MIADKQQKDPREYLPIIDELRCKTPEEYRYYSICVRLQDWKLALKHIANVPERFEECLLLIKQRELYVDALKIFNNTEKYEVGNISIDLINFFYRKFVKSMPIIC
jgi:elongator complex protein 1